MKKINQCISLILCCVMFFSACKKEPSVDIPAEDNKVLQGYYNEDAIDLGLPSNSKLICFNRNKVNELEAFYVNDTTPKTYGKATKKENQWVLTEENWLSDIDLPQEFELNQVVLGEDGMYYVLFQKCNQSKVTVRIYQIQENKTVSQISLSGWEDEQEEDIRYPIKRISVLKNGKIVVKDYQEEMLSIYQNDGSLVQEKSYTGTFTVHENTIYAIDSSSHMLHIINENGEDTKLSYASNQQGDYIYYFNNILWYVGKTGINRLNLNGSIWQNVISGENTCMGDDTTFTYDFAAKDGEASDEYYFIVDQGNGTELIHYYFDEEKKVSKDEKLVIYSLQSSATVDNIIREFRKEHPEVQLEYQVGEATDNTATTEETIRTLNTELLAGKGPDIILLDGLPIQSYEEKNVLLDLSSVLNPLNDKLYSNLFDCYQKENGIFTVPLRFQYAGIFGYKDVVEKILCMDTQDISGVNKEIENVFPYSNFNAFARIFYLFFKERLVTNDIVDEEKLEQFLTNLKYLSSRCSNEEKSTGNVFLNTDQGMIKLDDLYLSQEACLSAKKGCAGIYQYRCLEELCYTFSAIQEMKLTYSTVDGQYVPNDLIAINKNSKNQELATEFLEMALDSKTQETYIGNGFPVNKEAYASWKEWLYTDEDCFSFDEYVFRYPREEEFQILKDMIPGCKVAMNYDKSIDDHIIDLIQEYLEGNSSLDDTLTNIISTIELHNAE